MNSCVFWFFFYACVIFIQLLIHAKENLQHVLSVLVGPFRWQRRWISWLHLELYITTRAVMRKPYRCTERPPACNQTTQTFGWLLWACAQQHITLTAFVCPVQFSQDTFKKMQHTGQYISAKYKLAFYSSQEWLCGDFYTWLKCRLTYIDNFTWWLLAIDNK